MAEDYLTPSQAAALLGTHVSSVHRLLKRGQLTAIKESPPRLLIPRSEVEHYSPARMATIRQAAAYLGVSRQAVHKAIQAGRLPAIADCRPIRVLWADVKAYRVSSEQLARKRQHLGN